jgi:hypothetical protein
MCSLMNGVWSVDRSEMDKGIFQFTKLFSDRPPCQSDTLMLLFVENSLLNFVTTEALGQHISVLIVLHTELQLGMR